MSFRSCEFESHFGHFENLQMFVSQTLAGFLFLYHPPKRGSRSRSCCLLNRRSTSATGRDATQCCLLNVDFANLDRILKESDVGRRDATCRVITWLAINYMQVGRCVNNATRSVPTFGRGTSSIK